jgi:hypothetical protein
MNLRNFRRRSIGSSLLSIGRIWSGLTGLDMILWRIRRRELQLVKFLVPKPTLMLRRRKFIGCCGNPFESIIGSLKKAKGIINLNLEGLGVRMLMNCAEQVKM